MTRHRALPASDSSARLCAGWREKSTVTCATWAAKTGRAQGMQLNDVRQTEQAQVRAMGQRSRMG